MKARIEVKENLGVEEIFEAVWEGNEENYKETGVNLVIELRAEGSMRDINEWIDRMDMQEALSEDGAEVRLIKEESKRIIEINIVEYIRCMFL